MDEIPSLERRPGGSVEPMSRAAVIKSQFRIPGRRPASASSCGIPLPK